MNKFEDRVDYLVKFLSLAKPDRKGALGGTVAPIQFFDQAIPILDEEINTEATSDSNEFAVFLDATYDDIDNYIDICMLSKANEDELYESEKLKFGGYRLTRVRTVRAKNLRGKTRIVTPYIVETTIGVIDKFNRLTSVREYLGSFNKKKWQELMCERPAGDDVLDTLKVAFGLEFNKQLYWNVCLGEEGKPRLRLATDPVGAMEVFKLRDVPEGKKRRSALRNWISAHWRKKSKDPSALIEVRKHLRGATKFCWNGLHCQIIPSLDAIKENEDLRQAARIEPVRRIKR